jgi:hypothetical protein
MVLAARAAAVTHPVVETAAPAKPARPLVSIASDASVS